MIYWLCDDTVYPTQLYKYMCQHFGAVWSVGNGEYESQVQSVFNIKRAPPSEMQKDVWTEGVNVEWAQCDIGCL